MNLSSALKKQPAPAGFVCHPLCERINPSPALQNNRAPRGFLRLLFVLFAREKHRRRGDIPSKSCTSRCQKASQARRLFVESLPHKKLRAPCGFLQLLFVLFARVTSRTINLNQFMPQFMIIRGDIPVPAKVIKIIKKLHLSVSKSLASSEIIC